MAEWKPIDELFDYEKGTLQSSKCTPGKYTFITAAEEWKTHEAFTHDCEALIFAMAASGSLGRTHYIKGKFISSDLCFILTPKKGLRLDLIFYHRLFNFLRTDIVKKTATGTSKLAINQTNFGAYKLPYFDYEHQLSFRSKIETIAGINEEFSDGVDCQLSLLTKLRQSVLQEAIEGKLTVEWRKQNSELISGENHASKLLEKIKTEKERLIKEKKIKKDNPLSLIADEEKPFVLPQGWTWCRLEDVGIINPRNYIDDGLEISFSPMRLISGEYGISPTYEKRKWGEVKKGFTHFAENDVAIAKITPCFENSKACVFENLINGYGAGTTELHVLRPIQINSKYVYIFVKTSSFLKNGEKIMTGVCGQKRVPVDYFTNALLPLPPFNEQEVIISRVKELMRMIDELEKQVTERKDQSGMLTQSVLQEAFA